MSGEAANIFLVARHGHVVYVRAVGLSNMKNAPLLDAFLGAECTTDVHTVCVDLSACSGMDSTFMGLLAGNSARMRPHGGKLVVVNPTESGMKLLRLLGLSEVIPVLEGCELPALQFVSLGGSATLSNRERMRLIQRAHQHLMALNDANKAKFAAFMVALEADLAKLDKKDGRDASGAQVITGAKEPKDVKPAKDAAKDVKPAKDAAKDVKPAKDGKDTPPAT